MNWAFCSGRAGVFRSLVWLIERSMSERNWLGGVRWFERLGWGWGAYRENRRRSGRLGCYLKYFEASGAKSFERSKKYWRENTKITTASSNLARLGGSRV